jgi:hypothetical protein
MRSWTNGQLLRAVVVLAAAATLCGLVDVVLGARGRDDVARLEQRVHELEREVEALRAPAPDDP